MASLMTIPVELILEIVNLILDNRLKLPAVGQDVVMFAPPNSQIVWNLKPSVKKRISQRIPWRDSSEVKRKVQETASARTAHCSLKALRATNRFFDEICRPFLYRELNLLSDLKLKQWKRAKHIIPLPRWSHIQSISVYMDPSVTYLDPANPLALAPFMDQATTVAYILEKCRNVRSVALYYRDARVRTVHISFALQSLLKEGRLTALGFYSRRLLHIDAHQYHRDPSEAEGVIDLLESIALYEPAQRSLLTLDVVADWIPVRIFDLIRSNFKALTSLKLCRIVRDPWFKGRIWDIDQQSKWHPYPNLTRLHLEDFEPGYAAHFPSLVRHFKALDVLKISACGKGSGQMKRRAPGWSQQTNSLWNTHRTLKALYIAHMDGWEINELGVIPTATVIITEIKRDTLAELFSQDQEIFPGVQVLRLNPPKALACVVTTSKVKLSMETICNARGVCLRDDVPIVHWYCKCAFHYEA